MSKNAVHYFTNSATKMETAQIRGYAVEKEEPFDLDADIEGDIITIVGSAYHQPIADLIGQLAARKQKPSEGYMAGHFENGYCASIVILLVLAFESYISRVAFLRNKRLNEARSSAPKSTHEYLKHIDNTFPFSKELLDIYVVRDSLAHGHLWNVDYVIKSEGTDVTRRELFDGFGDKKMRSRVNMVTGKTRHLGLNALPTSVGLNEAAAVFKIVAQSLDHLVKAGLIEQAAVRGHVRYGGKTLQFWSMNAVLAEMVSVTGIVSG